MRTISTVLTLSAFVASASAWAQGDPASVTAAREAEVTKGLLQDETFAAKPLAGVLVYEDALGDDTSRFSTGLLLEGNLLPAFRGELTRWYMGPSTGLIFSHMGDPTSKFFGSDSDTGIGQANANMFFIPTNLKIGYAISDAFRISAHGGGNLVYRSVANSVNLGQGSDSSGPLWKYYPNVGADLDMSLGKTVEFSLRPNLTIAPENVLFSGTLGVGFFIG